MTELNPRPPKQWWDMMYSRARNTYAKKRSETEEQYKEALNQIVGGIWWKRYTEETRQKLIAKYDRKTVPAANPKVQMLPCPSCKAENPISRAGVYLKCKSCGKSLVSVRVRRKK